jgi:hypothetical protein
MYILILLYFIYLIWGYFILFGLPCFILFSMGWMIGVRVLAGAWNFSQDHCIQTGPGAHPASYPMGTRDSFPWAEAARGVKLTTHLHLELRSRMRGAIPPLPQYASMAWCSVKKKSAGTNLRLPFVALHHRVQNGSGAHPASYPMDTRVSFPGGKAARAWSWPLTSI